MDTQNEHLAFIRGEYKLRTGASRFKADISKLAEFYPQLWGSVEVVLRRWQTTSIEQARVTLDLAVASL